MNEVILKIKWFAFILLNIYSMFVYVCVFLANISQLRQINRVETQNYKFIKCPKYSRYVKE